MLLTANQIRAARALLNWSQTKLAEASGLSLMTIRRMEDGSANQARRWAANVEAVRTVLEAAGVIFQAPGEMVDGGAGVRLRRKEEG